MDILQALSMVLPLAVAAGVNLYATVLILGLCVRYDLVSTVPPVFEPMASDTVLLVAAIFYLLEFMADKVQFVDNLWDLIHTLVRPIGSAVIAFSAIWEIEPEMAVIAAMVSGSAALVSHGGKAGSRVALNVTSPAENISNIGISLIEDILVSILAVLALTYPYVATAIALVILALILVFVPPLLRWSWFNLTAILARLRGIVRPVQKTEPLPVAHEDLLPGTSILSARCRAQHIKGANGRRGFLSLVQAQLCFTYEGWFHRHRLWHTGWQQIVATTLKRGLLMDVLEVECAESPGKTRLVRFVFTKDRAPLVQQFATRLER